MPLYSVTYQGIRIGSVAREPRRTHWVALSIIDNQAAKFATRLGARRPMTTPLSTEADREELDLLLRGFEISRMLRLVADLGVADKVPIDGHITVHDLAASCSVLPEPLLRILRALAAVRIFQLALEGAVSHTPRSRLLRTDTPNSFHYSARFWTGRGSWRAWEELDAAMTGGIPHETAWGVARFDYLRQHPVEARVFDAMMATFPDNRHAAVASAYDFSGAKLIVDIGGGNGSAPATSSPAFRDRVDLSSTMDMSLQQSSTRTCWRGGSPPRAGASSIRFRVGPTSTCSSGFCTTGRMRTA